MIFLRVTWLLNFWVLLKQSNADDGLDFNLFHQHDYQVKFERLELERYNKSFGDFSIRTFKYNRTLAVVNITITPTIDIGSELTYIVQAYKFMSNEYRTFPMRFAVNGCKARAADVVGLVNGFSRCGNFTPCFHPKGITIHICNWYPDSSKLPPLIPDGQYKIELQMLRYSQEICIVNAYGTVSRPIVYKNTNATSRKG